MKRDLEQMETIHNMYVAYRKQSFLTDILLLTMIIIAIFCCGVVVVGNLEDGRIWVVVIEVLLIWLNIFNGLNTVKRMIEARKDSKEELRLYEEARAEMVKICEISEVIGEEIGIDFEEELE